MERLTIEYCGEYVPKELCSIDRLGGADDCDLCCEYCKATEEGSEDCRGCAINQCFNKLGKYEDLEEQGKLLKLPCAVGDTVYQIEEPDCELCETERPEIYEKCTYTFGEFCGYEEITELGFELYLLYVLDKTVFLTREEAEAALKELWTSNRP